MYISNHHLQWAKSASVPYRTNQRHWKANISASQYLSSGDDFVKEPLRIHHQSCYLFGRERRVADIPTDHPSCSKQHAVLQYRQLESDQAVQPYLMDLGSTNGTYINCKRMEPQSEVLSTF
ncbi:RNA splicing factor [Lithospermum erythrorhizon]|uniref:RNA splicing factor n=1 Tax=Lithospermum erythrorhizon TaxID=34254 RepID=A0AAV3R823_LITER